MMKLLDIMNESSIISERTIGKANKMFVDYKAKVDKLDDIITKAKQERQNLVRKEKGNYKKELKGIISELASELKKLGINNPVSDDADYTKINIKDIASIRIGNALGDEKGKIILYFGKPLNWATNKKQVLKPNTSIKDIAQLIKKNK